jgi:PBSX family phage terminase large subunit
VAAEKLALFEPHSAKQEDLIFSDEEITIGATGTQWGKSKAGSLWMKRQIHTFTEKSDNFLLMAPTYKIMNQSMLPYFLSSMEGYGHYNKAEAVYEIKGGGIAYFRTETDPDSIVGIPKTRAYWLDEAGKVGLYFWENVQARAASVGAIGLLTTSPYSRNWLYQNYIKPKKVLPNVRLIQAPSWENPYHTLSDVSKRNSKRAEMDPRRFDMLFGGEWGQMQGLVYDCFDEDQNQIEPHLLPRDTKYYAGIDWGFTEPFVLKIRGITPSGDEFGVSEFYKSGLTITDILEVAQQKMKLFNIQRFFCGPDQPGYIEEFCRNGMPAVKADNDVRRGIDLHYDIIRSRKLKYFKGHNPYTLDEIETYHYPDAEDLGPDDDSKELSPVGQHDHALDADRYLTIMTRNLGKHVEPKVPELKAKTRESYEQRFKRLTKRSRSGQTESW